MSIEGYIIYNMYNNLEEKETKEKPINSQYQLGISNLIERYKINIFNEFKNIINFNKTKK